MTSRLQTQSSGPSPADYAADMNRYMDEGFRRGEEIGNRGPVEFDDQGYLSPSILEAFGEHGFYIFENLVDEQEIMALRRDVQALLERAPTGNDMEIDAQGRPAFGVGFRRSPFTFVKPLSDPWGGTDLLGGRHQTKMAEPRPDSDAPSEVVYLINGMCHYVPSGLLLYGHPHLLAIAASINGDDFVPFNDAIFVKQAGLGGSVSWHQDGVTHWDSPNWDPGIHGFNFQVQLYASTPANCLWVMPGTHKLGRIDIREQVRQHESERLPGAVPLTCKSGDVTIVNRQMLHCSFANVSSEPRISMTFGFHRRNSVLGQRGALSQNSGVVYDEDRIRRRSGVIAMAVDARRQARPDETPFRYQPFDGLDHEFHYDPATFDDRIREYFFDDLSI